MTTAAHPTDTAQTRFSAWTTDLHINGRPVRGQGSPLRVEDPSTGQVLAEVSTGTPDQLDEAVAAASRAFESWSRLPGEERSGHMFRWADTLEARRGDLIDTIVSDVGAPISLAGPIQVDMVTEHLRWYAGAATRDRTVDFGPDAGPPMAATSVKMVPAGVVAAIPAYNVPMSLTINKVGAALAAGCTVVVMAPPQAPLSVLMMVELATEAGLPPGVLNVLLGGPDLARQLTVHPRVDKIGFTGSRDVGAKVMAQAAPGIKGVVLELGGKSPCLLMPDADFSAYADVVHGGYTLFAGQNCGAPTRILVPKARYDEFTDVTLTRYDAGFGAEDPWDPTCQLGPLITRNHLDRVCGMVDEALAEGAHVVAQGKPALNTDGYFCSPVLLGGVDSQATIAQEEVFGPVAVVLTYDDLDDAIRLANDVKYGLHASVIGPDATQIADVIERLRAGLVTVNGGGKFSAHGELFGGMKQSGIGREWGEWGIQEYLEPQYVIEAL